MSFHSTKIDVNDEHINYSEIAKLFWNIYESAEVRFIKKYLDKNKDIIELGSSLGAVSSVIGLIKNEDKYLYCFEANPNLIKLIEKNLEGNGISNFTIHNNAIGSINSEKIIFEIGSSNLVSKISEDTNGVLVNTIDLSNFVIDKQLKSFNLICDMEGAESYLIFEQSDVLKSCSTLIIELHNTEYNNTRFSYQELNESILELGYFNLIDNYGAVYVYKAKQF